MDSRLETLASALGFLIPAGEVLSRMHQLYSDLQARLEAHPFPEAPCRKGCDACCHESVFLSAPEFLFIAEQILSEWTDAERTALLVTMGRLADRFEDEFEQLALIEDGPERDDVAARIKFACPLLGDEGACRVYSRRELNARTFGHTYDSRRREPYGCELTHDRLRVLPDDRTRGLFDARAARKMLAARLPNTELVHVFPYWFRHFGHLLA